MEKSIIKKIKNKKIYTDQFLIIIISLCNTGYLNLKNFPLIYEYRKSEY